MRGNDQPEAGRMGQPLTPVEVIREALARVQGQLEQLGEVDMGDDREAALQGQITGLEFALRALGVETRACAWSRQSGTR